MGNIKMGLTIEEAAECTGIGRNTMRKLVDWGKLPVLKVGRKAIIKKSSVIIYSHICHSSPIATLCYILL